MNLEEKIKRLVELKKIQYPSDQEVEEKKIASNSKLLVSVLKVLHEVSGKLDRQIS